MVLKKILIALPLIIIFVALFRFSPTIASAQGFQSTNVPNCPRSLEGKVICPTYNLSEDFCVGGTIISGRADECGCERPPVCQQTTNSTTTQATSSAFDPPSNPGPTAPPRPDLNGDGITNLEDLAIIKTKLLRPNQDDADFNRDGKVDLIDYSILVNAL